MAYGDSVGDNARLLRRTISGVADFSGRSRRTEVIYYWIATALFGIVLGCGVSAFVPLEPSMHFSNALRLLLTIPMFALFVRRLHDQNRSGWLGLLLPLSLLLSVPGIIADVSGNIEEIIAQRNTPMAIAGALCALAVFVLSLLPGSEGDNSYGPDPRLEEA